MVVSKWQRYKVAKFFQEPIRLSAVIFLFLFRCASKKQKGFPLQSGLGQWFPIDGSEFNHLPIAHFSHFLIVQFPN